MPICLRADKTFKYSLPGDRSIPAAKRPHFLARHFTAGQQIEIRQRVMKIENPEAGGSADWKEQDKALDTEIGAIVAGVVNMGEYQDLASLLPNLSRGEKFQLIFGVLAENEMTEDDAKNSALP